MVLLVFMVAFLGALLHASVFLVSSTQNTLDNNAIFAGALLEVIFLVSSAQSQFVCCNTLSLCCNSLPVCRNTSSTCCNSLSIHMYSIPTVNLCLKYIIYVLQYFTCMSQYITSLCVCVCIGTCNSSSVCHTSM